MEDIIIALSQFYT